MSPSGFGISFSNLTDDTDPDIPDAVDTVTVPREDPPPAPPTAAPAPAPARATKAPRKVTSRPASAPSNPLEGVDAFEVVIDSWPTIGTIDPTVGLDDARSGESVRLSKGLPETVRFAMIPWLAAHPAYRKRGTYTFRGAAEGLIRVGLKHVDDPDLMRAIPARRKPVGGPVEVSFQVSIPGPVKGPVPIIDGWSTVDMNSAKAELTLPMALRELIDDLAIRWASTHPVYVQVRKDFPSTAGLYEGLIRLGLKHINDPQLEDWIVGDRRTNHHR